MLNGAQNGKKEKTDREIWPPACTAKMRYISTLTLTVWYERPHKWEFIFSSGRGNSWDFSARYKLTQVDLSLQQAATLSTQQLRCFFNVVTSTRSDELSSPSSTQTHFSFTYIIKQFQLSCSDEYFTKATFYARTIVRCDYENRKTLLRHWHECHDASRATIRKHGVKEGRWRVDQTFFWDTCASKSNDSRSIRGSTHSSDVL
jgi:hypothetical protein